MLYTLKLYANYISIKLEKQKNVLKNEKIINNASQYGPC